MCRVLSLETVVYGTRCTGESRVVMDIQSGLAAEFTPQPCADAVVSGNRFAHATHMVHMGSPTAQSPS